MNIHEVMQYGPIVAHDEDYDILVTVNGAYFNIWAGEARFSPMGRASVIDYNTTTEPYDAAPRVGDPEDISPFRSVPFWDVVTAAERLLGELLEEGGEEE